MASTAQSANESLVPAVDRAGYSSRAVQVDRMASVGGGTVRRSATMNRLLCCSFVLAFASACSHPGSTERLLLERAKAPKSVFISARVAVPFAKGDDGGVYVEVKVQTKNLLLKVDTGATGVILDSSLARELAIALAPLEYTGKWAAGYAPSQIGIVPELQIGTASIKEVTALFRDLGSSPLKMGDGILGGAVLAVIGAKIDFAQSCLVMHSDPIPEEAVSVPLIKGEYGMLFVEVQYEAARHLLLVDTGSDSLLLLDSSLAKEHRIAFIPGEGTVTLPGGKFPIQAGKLPEFRLGSTSVRDVTTFFADLSSFRLQFKKHVHLPVEGILGTPLLWILGATIDYEHGCLILKQAG